MQITVIIPNHPDITLEAREGASLLPVLRNAGIYLSSPCGGHGTCGKCRVLLNEDPSFHLACRTAVQPGLRVYLPAEEENYVIAGDSMQQSSSTGDSMQQSTSAGDSAQQSSSQSAAAPSTASPVYAAVDLGTTTIAMEALSQQGEILASWAGMNPQRTFGADVVSRQKAAAEGSAGALCELVRKALTDGLSQLESQIGRPLAFAALAGNTTMVHLLMGWSTKGLAAWPFAPVSLAETQLALTIPAPAAFPASTEIPAPEAVPASDEIQASAPRPAHELKLHILPGISAYIGADITAGIYAAGMDQMEENSLLVDLGTNGEMALGSRRGIWTASTAAGPAFEGADITCGTGSIPGAISDVAIEGAAVRLTLIPGSSSQPAAAGICGSGLIAAICELRRAGVLDETGLLADPYFDEGFPLTPTIRLYQSDIRKLQTAKAAIAAGIGLLVEQSGLKTSEISQVFLAGGFGSCLDVDKAIGIGLLPAWTRGKAKAVGNLALTGAALAARNAVQSNSPDPTRSASLDPARSDSPNSAGVFPARLTAIAAASHEVVLGDSSEFQDRFIDEINFPDLT